jgi:D-alanine-D-alanine ligase
MITVGVLFGGRSGEHEVSRCSAASVFAALDRAKYSVIAIGIDYDGRWYPQSDPQIVDDPAFGRVLTIRKNGNWLVNHFENEGKLILHETKSGKEISVDLVFPVIHGTYCEDGTLQGLLELACVPYVGAGVLGSSAGMDKDATKRLLRDRGIPVVPWFTIDRDEWDRSTDDLLIRIEKEFGYPFFVKPANAGSSVGVHKVKDRAAAELLVADSLRYDLKVIIEPSVDCREIECAVLGNGNPRASVLGEVIPTYEFYSYEAKYMDADGAKLAIPAPLSDGLSDKIRSCAVEAFTSLYLEGLARVDFFLDRKTNEFFLNEPNTLPGFTSISMYPKLWQATGLSYTALLDELIDCAFSRASSRRSIETRFAPKKNGEK